MADERKFQDNILQVNHLKKYFPLSTNLFGKPTRVLKAVDDVTFGITRGTCMGIVGESGCGKTTLGRTILRLHEATDGEIIFDGRDITKINHKELRALRPEMQIIFQDPYSSLSPRMPIGDIIGEAPLAHKLVTKADYKDYVIDVMEKCGLPSHYFSRYPHEFSGGQRQRICIARALALKPKFVVCDEPVSALDVSIQAQIINLLKELLEKMNLTYMFISHDLSVVEHISDDVAVMYLGNMVESGFKEKIFAEPLHPYTQSLFSAVPIPDPKVKMDRIILQGDIPSPANPPKGCKFHTRCNKCMDICKEVEPKYIEYEYGHRVACHLYPEPKNAKKDETPIFELKKEEEIVTPLKQEAPIETAAPSDTIEEAPKTVETVETAPVEAAVEETKNEQKPADKPVKSKNNHYAKRFNKGGKGEKKH